MKNILVTGCAGFIGFHLCNKLINKNYNIIGIDNLNNYYDTKLKKDRLNILKNKNKNFIFVKADLKSYQQIAKIFVKYKFDVVINLAAQAGVRHSIKDPKAYFENNIKAFFNLIENCKINKIKHLLTASTSSVYGASEKFPLKEYYQTENPLSFYAASKKTNEVLGYSYSNIYKLPITFMRFFTVYGTYGRPDMSLYIFTERILNNKKINLHNNGKHIRDFTHVSDVVNAIDKLISKKPTNTIPFRVLNIASGKPIELKKFLLLIELNLGKKAIINKLPLQLGDVYKTHSSIKKINKLVNYKPKMSIENGIKEFVHWYKSYYKIN